HIKDAAENDWAPSIGCGSSTDAHLTSPGTYSITEGTVLGWSQPGAGTDPVSGQPLFSANGLQNGWTAPGSIVCTGGGGIQTSNNGSLSGLQINYGQNVQCFVLNVSNACTPKFPPQP